VRFVSENFVPVAVDKQKLIHAQDARERFAEERKLIELFTRGRTGNLAVHLINADGEPLTDKEIFRMQSAADVLATLKNAVAKFGPVTRRNVKPQWQSPDKGVGVRPDGSVRLTLYVRHTDRNDHTARPVFDSIILTKEQWRDLAPPDRSKIGSYEVPASTVRQFARALSASSDLSTLHRPEDLSVARLTGTVSKAGPSGETQVVLRGELVGSRKYVNGPEPLPGRTSFDGLLTLGRNGQPTRLLMVGDGTFKMPWDRQDRPTGSLVEWKALPTQLAN